MPTIREYKVAIKASILSYLAGAHGVTETAWQACSDDLTGEKRKSTHKKMETFLKTFTKDAENGAHLADLLNEEGVYPFADEWSPETISKLMQLVKPLKVSEADAFDSDHIFKFKKGFHKDQTSAARSRYSVADEDADIAQSGLDHWLSLILNLAFHAGAVAAARSTKTDSKAFYSALSALEQEADPWAKYPQLVRLYDNELANDEGYEDDGDDSDDDGDDDEDFESRGFGYDGDDDDDGY